VPCAQDLFFCTRGAKRTGDHSGGILFVNSLELYRKERYKGSLGRKRIEGKKRRKGANCPTSPTGGSHGDSSQLERLGFWSARKGIKTVENGWAGQGG